MNEPLWLRALAAREIERIAEKQSKRAKNWRRPDCKRKFPLAKVGDEIGGCTVVALMHPDGTSNERVMARCSCGHEAPSYVFNLRKRKGTCPHNRTAPE